MSHKINGDYLNVEQALTLLERSEELSRKDIGSLRLHWLQNDSGKGLLIQGPNGEFVHIKGECELN